MPDQTRVPVKQFAKADDSVELIMPARENMLTLTRLTVAGLLAHVSRDFDLQEDIKSAAAEACYCLMQQPCEYTRIGLRFVMDESELVFSVNGLAPATDANHPECVDKSVDVALCILESMVDGVDIAVSDGVIAGFTLKKHIA